MRQAALDAFIPLTVAFEGGYIGWMFPDVKGLVSTGFGLLLDPVGMALTLPWRRPDGALATREEIVADWANVKNHPGAARLGHKSVEHVARLRLDREGMDQAVAGKLRLNEAILCGGFQDWDSWPADAQLGAMSMAWAVGPSFWKPTAGRCYFPNLTAALRAKDFRTASVECFLPEEKTISGLRLRNRANRILFTNAAVAQEEGLDPEELFYPRSLAEADTTPKVAMIRPPPPAPDFATVHPLRYPFPDDDDGPPEAA